MTTNQKVFRNKVGLLELAKLLGNVSQACRIMGCNREGFCSFRELYDRWGETTLEGMAELGPSPKNQVEARPPISPQKATARSQANERLIVKSRPRQDTGKIPGPIGGKSISPPPGDMDPGPETRTFCFLYVNRILGGTQQARVTPSRIDDREGSN
jgi:hypothetical protein